jgi:Ethanolamine utilization protein EutJ (predicted chaperonin)
MTASVHESIGRLHKARKIVAVLVSAGLDDPDLLDEPMWAAAIEAAQVRTASEATRAVVLDLLRERVA